MKRPARYYAFVTFFGALLVAGIVVALAAGTPT